MTRWATDEDWMEVKRRALGTIGLTTVITPPGQVWKEKMLRARHSPIRYLRFSFDIWLPSYIATHLARHIHAQPYISTQRNDRQDKYDRCAARQDTMVYMIWDVGGEELLNVANKRLCNCADPTTQMVVQRICKMVKAQCPEFAKELVPMCVYRGCCPEMFPCKGGPNLDY